MAPSGSYDAFARYYDAYWAHGYLQDFEDALKHEILPLVPPRARVLDLCCGPGRLAAWLTERGFDVTGLDISAEMIAEAKRIAPEARFITGDAREFKLEEPVALAISTFDSINHFETLDELEGLFGCVRTALEDDGLFCFDFNTTEGFEYSAGETYAAVDDEHVCISKSKYDRQAGRGVSQLTVFERDGEAWRRSDAEIKEYWHRKGDIEERLRRAGFGGPRLFEADADFGMPHGDGRLFALVRPK